MREPEHGCATRDAVYEISSDISIVARDATSPGIQKQNRVTPSHSGPLRPEHRQQGLYPCPDPDTEANHAKGSTAEETTQQYVKSCPQNSSTRHHRHGTS